MKIQLSFTFSHYWSRLALVVGLVISLLAALHLNLSNANRIEDAVIEAAQRANHSVQERIDLYVYGLRGSRGAIVTAGEHGITRELFRQYSLTRDPDREFPGARGFGFIRRVAQSEEAAFVQMARADGWPGYEIKELNSHGQERYLIQYIEPVGRNIQAVGLDIGSERNRREAAEAAMLTGEVRLTGPITLVQATGNPLQSFLILMPIYRTPDIPATLAERNALGYGWSYAPLLMKEVLADMRLDSAAMHLELHDITTAGREEMFYSSDEAADNLPPLHTYSTRFNVYGRQWESRFSVHPLFVEHLHLVQPFQVFMTGVLISLLAAALIGAVAISRQNREKALAEQARLAAIVESSADGIIGQSLDGVVTSWNRGAEQLFGFPAAMATGKRASLLIVPEQLEAEERDLLGRVRKGEQVPHFETVRQRQDGSQFHVSITISPVVDNGGRVVGASMTVRDISVQKNTEARILELNSDLETQVRRRTSELAELNSLFQNVLDAASEVSIIATDPDGLICLFNTGAERLLGYSAKEMIDQHTPFSFHLPEEVASRGEQLTREHGRAIEGLEIFTLIPELEGVEAREWSYVRKDGSLVPVMLMVTARHDERGRLTGYLGIATDITAQRRHQAELTAAHDQLLMAADVAGMGVWSWDLADNSLNWNDRMFELYQQPLSLKGKGLCYEHWLERVHPDDAEATAACLAAAVQGWGTYDPVFRILLPDGEIRYIQAGAQIERDDQGEPVRVTGINLDITAQHQLETQLRQAKQQADDASAAKSSFLANMSHEIRTPMNAVLGMLKLLQQTELNPRQEDYVSKAHIAARSLLGLLNDILDYSKIEAGKLHLEMHPFELEELMRDLAVVLSGNIDNKPVELMFDLPPSLPTHLIGDQLRLQQVLINLAGNALKFTNRGEVVVSISEVSRDLDEVRLRIAVTDSGIGIAPDKLEHIFEGFTQAEATTARRFGGTGLGLVISRRLVGMMGGMLQVRSALGKGSCFWFEINLGIDDWISSQPEQGVVNQPLRVLAVDDNPVTSEILARTLTALGWQVVTEDSGERAVAAIERDPGFDLVLMDWSMPGMDGIEAARKIKQISAKQQPAIIMLTACGWEELAETQKHPGRPFADYLVKPITTQQLVASVQKVLAAGGSPEPDRPRQAPQREQRLSGLRLLVVEDNAFNRQVAAELLSSEGASVELAEGGLEGVQKVIADPDAVDIVLMDMQMPDIDGLEATRRIRMDARCQHLPILAMTANVTMEDKAACLQAGMNSHVGKPIDIDELVATLLAHWQGTPPLAVAPAEPAPAVSKLEHLDIILRRFGGDATLYRNLLVNMEANSDVLFKDLERHLNAADRDAVAAVLHTFKGVAGTMGAAGFAHRMAELEREVRGPEYAQALARLDREHLQELKSLLIESRAELMAAVGDPGINKKADSRPVQAVTGAGKGQFEKLLALLDGGNLEAIDIVETLPEGTGRRAELVAEVQNLNFETASVIVREILEGV